MNGSGVTIFFSAAEASGDAHAAGLIAALRARLPKGRFLGAGGDKMARAGCEILQDLTAEADMITGPLGRLGYYVHHVRRLQKALRAAKPDVVVPVDSPAFNWHIAKAARKCGAPVMYYVAPQLWAWAPWRIRKARRLIDRLACILPFEEEYFRSRGVRASFVGHPLFDHLPPRPANPPDIDEVITSGAFRVALLPGSRPMEIRDHTPAMLAVAQAIGLRWPAARCTLAAPNEAAAARIREAAAKNTMPLAEAPAVVTGGTPQILAESHFAVVASGTATLEAAYFGVPMVIIYRIGRLGYRLVGHWLIRTPFLSLVNILAGRAIVPELMPWFGDVQEVIEKVLVMMADRQRLHAARRDLLAVADGMKAHATSAAEGAADLVMELLAERRR